MAVILIIEDAVLSRRMLRRTLEAEGYTILEAGNGQEGLEMIRLHQPDCIFLDLLMPEMNGQQVLAAMQAEGIRIPTIVLTADIQKTTQQECLSLGAFAVIHKIANREELLPWVNKAMEVLPETGAYEPNF